MDEQLSFNLDGAPETGSGLTLWREQRRRDMDALAARCGLPIGHLCRVWLTSGVRLEGQLLLAHEDLWENQARSTDLRLQIGRADFGMSEIESCARLD